MTVKYNQVLDAMYNHFNHCNSLVHHAQQSLLKDILLQRLGVDMKSVYREYSIETAADTKTYLHEVMVKDGEGHHEAMIKINDFTKKTNEILDSVEIPQVRQIG